MNKESHVSGSGNLISFPDLERLCATLRILAHPMRLRVIDFLLTAGEPQRVTEIVAVSEAQNQSIVSQQLFIMRQAGVLTCERRGTCVYYQVSSNLASELLKCLQKDAGEIDCAMKGKTEKP